MIFKLSKFLSGVFEVPKLRDILPAAPALIGGDAGGSLYRHFSGPRPRIASAARGRKLDLIGQLIPVNYRPN